MPCYYPADVPQFPDGAGSGPAQRGDGVFFFSGTSRIAVISSSEFHRKSANHVHARAMQQRRGAGERDTVYTRTGAIYLIKF